MTTPTHTDYSTSLAVSYQPRRHYGKQNGTSRVMSVLTQSRQPLSVMQIAEFTNVTIPTVKRILSKQVKAKLVEHDGSRSDKRKYSIVI